MKHKCDQPYHPCISKFQLCDEETSKHQEFADESKKRQYMIQLKETALQSGCNPGAANDLIPKICHKMRNQIHWQDLKVFGRTSNSLRNQKSLDTEEMFVIDKLERLRDIDKRRQSVENNENEPKLTREEYYAKIRQEKIITKFEHLHSQKSLKQLTAQNMNKNYIQNTMKKLKSWTPQAKTTKQRKIKFDLSAVAAPGYVDSTVREKNFQTILKNSNSYKNYSKTYNKSIVESPKSIMKIKKSSLQVDIPNNK